MSTGGCRIIEFHLFNSRHDGGFVVLLVPETHSETTQNNALEVARNSTPVVLRRLRQVVIARAVKNEIEGDAVRHGLLVGNDGSHGPTSRRRQGRPRS